jgi:site-specific recombinase XerD
MMTPLRQRMLEELQRRNYCSGTIRLYLRHVADFAQHFHRSPDQLGAEQIRQYQLFLIQQKKLAWSSYNQIVCALRFFYAKTLKRAFLLSDIPFPRKEQQLPLILSKEVVERILTALRKERTFSKRVLNLCFLVGSALIVCVLGGGAFIIAEIRHINSTWVFLSLISMGFFAGVSEGY